MSSGRIAVIAAGLLIAAVAFLLILRGFRGPAAGPAAEADQPAAGAAGGGKAQDKAPPPRWQSFTRPDERETPPRPIVRFAQGVPNPFDRLPVASPKPQNPGFRLEGISAGAQAVALISGRAMREGDTISGFRVVRISRSAVTLAGAQGARIGLTLEGGR
jgi:hypothetical protein